TASGSWCSQARAISCRRCQSTAPRSGSTSMPSTRTSLPRAAPGWRWRCGRGASWSRPALTSPIGSWWCLPTAKPTTRCRQSWRKPSACAQAASRRTAALIALAVWCGAAPLARAQDSTRPRSTAEKAWDRGDVAHAQAAYVAELTRRRQDDTAWYNAGTAALAGGDLETAQAALAHAAASLEPDIRFRALYNLGLLALRVADADSTNRDAHLAEAERAYRE